MCIDGIFGFSGGALKIMLSEVGIATYQIKEITHHTLDILQKEEI